MLVNPFRRGNLIATCAIALIAHWSHCALAESVNDFVLIYAGNSLIRPSWSPEELQPYLSCDGRVEKTRRFFRGFVVLETRSEAGHSFVHGSRARPGGAPATQEQWRILVDGWFGNSGVLWNLSRALDRVDSAATGQVWLGLPEPLLGANFELGGGHAKSLRNTDDKRLAVEWFVKKAMDNWKRERFSNLKLMGFYWVDESLKFTEDLVGEVSLFLKAQTTTDGMIKPLKLLWIPFWKSPKRDAWREYGFDVAVVQPNYFVKDGVERSRISEAKEYALKFGMGFELEFDQRLLDSYEHVYRAGEYLRVLEADKSMPMSLIGLYQGNAALLKAYSLQDSFLNMYVKSLCDFIADRKN